MKLASGIIQVSIPFKIPLHLSRSLSCTLLCLDHPTHISEVAIIANPPGASFSPKLCKIQVPVSRTNRGLYSFSPLPLLPEPQKSLPSIQSASSISVQPPKSFFLLLEPRLLKFRNQNQTLLFSAISSPMEKSKHQIPKITGKAMRA